MISDFEGDFEKAQFPETRMIPESFLKCSFHHLFSKDDTMSQEKIKEGILSKGVGSCYISIRDA